MVCVFVDLGVKLYISVLDEASCWASRCSAQPTRLFHGEQAGNLKKIHRDPFDRMLIAQAQAEGLDLMTADKVIPEYGLKVIDARL